MGNWGYNPYKWSYNPTYKWYGAHLVAIMEFKSSFFGWGAIRDSLPQWICTQEVTKEI